MKKCSVTHSFLFYLITYFNIPFMIETLLLTGCLINLSWHTSKVQRNLKFFFYPDKFQAYFQEKKKAILIQRLELEVYCIDDGPVDKSVLSSVLNDNNYFD